MEKGQEKTARNEASTISRFLYSWVIFFIVWLAFTSSLAPAEAITGLIVSFVIAIFSYERFTSWGFRGVQPKRLVYVVWYLIVFLIALVKANFNVARIVLTPSLPINPGIVEFETKLENEYAKMVLANSITLTPGTFTVDIIGNRFYIHWLEADVTDPDKVYREVAEPFEKILLKIFG